MRFSLILLAIALRATLSILRAEPEPIVRMLVPGFTVQEFPVRLLNINNLRFGPDGRLFALGYDGRIHALSDTDGDGLEDTDEIFWDKPTISVPVGMAWSKGGLYVSSHGKVSLLRDTNGDGKADTEEIIASGWPPTDVASGGVDASAVTLDKEGNVYFGLLVADYSNAYRLRKRKDLKPDEKAWLVAHNRVAEGDPEEEISIYDPNGMRGTIQKWSPKTKKLETIATGIRVPYALAFNCNGDLFVTDQEGETWCPNGNPLDELNHIIPGRNYGFPPRHEKYLPNLESEPPVVAFGPQHQSTCGLVFNEPKQGQGLFGPKWWAGDAFVAGESRGKIWRVRLVKTPYGYIGKEYLIARLSMLTTDVTISPKGDLYVSCHSGLPDWGTGPQGEGKIFKISYTDPKAPQPVIAWAAGPTEVRVAFDKPLDPSVINTATNQEIEFGEYVRAADRYEVLKPPYEVVKRQEATPRGKLRILSAKLSNNDQTVVLATDPHPQAVTYAVTLQRVLARGAQTMPATVDVDYDLSGVEINWARKPLASKLPKRLRKPAMDSGIDFLNDPQLAERWLPHPDLNVAKRILGPLWMESEDFGLVESKPPEIALLHFRIELPAGTGSVQLSATNLFTLVPPVRGGVAISNSDSGRYVLQVEVEKIKPTNNFYMGTSQRIAPVDFSYRELGADFSRPLPLNIFFTPWSPPSQPHSTLPPQNLELFGGDYERGKALFSSEQLKCATCHRIRGEGATVGPDLSNLVSRDARSVLRDIKEPSTKIHPDYVAYNVSLNNGEELSGFLRAQSETTLRLVGADGKERLFPRSDVGDLRPSSVSLMPTGLLDALKEESIRDLLTFLLNEPPKRSKAEVHGLLNQKSETRTPQLQIVLVASKQDHGPGQHDYPAWQNKWHGLFTQATDVAAANAWEWPTEEQFQSANVLVFYFWNHDWSAARYRQLDGYLARGGGVVLLHAATIADKEPEQLAERIGLAAQPGPTKYLHTPFDLKFVAPTNNPITRGFPAQIHFLDEPYWPMFGDTNKIEVLATTEQEGKSWPMIWTFQRGKGRVFASILGHYAWTLDDPLFRLLIFRGIAWSASEPPERFDDPAIVGAGRD